MVKNLPAMQETWIRFLGLGKGHGNSLQYSCLENPVDRGDWWATAHGVTKSQTRLNDLEATLRITYRESPERGELTTLCDWLLGECVRN